MMLSAVGIISLAGCSAGLLAALVLWRIPFGQRIANQVLAALMLLIALILLQRFLSAVGVVYRYPHLQGLAGPLGFLVGPLLYLYTRLMSERGLRLQRRQYWHLLPAVLSLIVYLPVYLSSADNKRAFIQSYLAPANTISANGLDLFDSTVVLLNLVESVGFAVSLGAYALVSLLLIRRHRLALVDTFSATERLTLSWLRNLALLALFTTLGMLLAIVLAPLGSSLLSSQWLPNLLLVIICFYGGYSGICQPAIYRNQVIAANIAGDSKTIPELAQVKYEKSGLDQAGQKLYWKRVQGFMLESKPYLTGGLTITQLAEAADIPVAYLSQTINAESGMSFFEFINHARIETARAMLESEPRLSLANLYLEVGFNSKSSFYTQFKIYSGGATPRQYLAGLSDKQAG